MSSFSVCSHCLRALRQSIRAEAKVSIRSQRHPARRYVSTLSPRWQQTTEHKISSSSKVQTIVPPTTTPTVTSNVAAMLPDTESAQQESPSSTEAQPIVPFTTTPTITSNVTAPAPDDAAGSSSAEASTESSALEGAASIKQMQREIRENLSRGKPSLPMRMAQSLQRNAPNLTRTYTIYGETELFVQSCAAQADYTIPEDHRTNILTGKGPPKTADQADLGVPVSPESWWFDTIGLPPTFATWSQVAFLHMFVLIVRLRGLETGVHYQDYHRYLIEHFSRSAEDKMILLHNMSAQGIRSRYLKDIFVQWRGLLASYDEGLVKGDAVLASAIWRNLFRAQEDVDWEKVALVVAYLRSSISTIGPMPMEKIIRALNSNSGLWPEQNVRIYQDFVSKPSAGLRSPFDEQLQ